MLHFKYDLVPVLRIDRIIFFREILIFKIKKYVNSTLTLLTRKDFLNMFSNQLKFFFKQMKFTNF
jgi:hypothetical protein